MRCWQISNTMCQNLVRNISNAFGNDIVVLVPWCILAFSFFVLQGDTTKLPYAVGLTKFERDLAHRTAIHASSMPGSPNIRVMMGHCHFGARICYGDCLLLTISPNEQHSGRPMDRFFDQWLYHARHPDLKISYKWMPKQNLAKVNIKQTQTLDDDVLQFHFLLSCALSFQFIYLSIQLPFRLAK